jgi:lipopolysaccharide exporter
MSEEEAPPSIGASAVRGASWTISAGLVSRALGLVGSVAITHFLDPQAIGEVGAAMVLVALANQMSTIGIGQYVLAKASDGPRATFHATVLHLVTGVVAIGLVVALASPLTALFNAPHAASFVPGVAVAIMLDRIGYVPERIVIRDLRFRTIAGTRALTDVANTGFSLGLAVLGFGGWAIVVANIVRSGLRAIVFIYAADRSAWLSPHRLSRAVYKSILDFGIPTWFGSICEFASARVDNLLISYLFGPRVMAHYQVAYNLADVPADQIGEQVAEVLLPSFVKMEPEERKKAVVSSAGLLAFVVFPVAIGFGAVGKTLIALMLRPVWADVAPMLTILCVLSLMRPLSWQLGAYLMASGRPRVAMVCSTVKLVVIVAFMLTVGRLGPLIACFGVGFGYGAALLIAQYSISRTDGVPMTAMLGRTLPPLVACAPMIAAVLGVRKLWGAAGLGPLAGLPIEILAGVLGFVLGAFTLTPAITREFIQVVREARARRRHA